MDGNDTQTRQSAAIRVHVDANGTPDGLARPGEALVVLTVRLVRRSTNNAETGSR